MTPLSFAFAHSLPEILLAIGALCLLMLGVFKSGGRDWIISAARGCAAAACSCGGCHCSCQQRCCA